MKIPLLVSTPTNVAYISGFTSHSPTEREAWVLLTETSGYFFSDSRYNDVLKAMKKRPDITPICISHENPLSSAISSILTKEDYKNLYFEADNLTMFEVTTLKKKLSVPLKETVGIIASQREEKNQKEVTKISLACDVINTCLKEISPMLKIGITEYEIAFKIEMWLKERGHDIAFAPIVAINENSAIPHYDTQGSGKKKITKNSIILIDAGAKVNGYCSDITRMFVVGKPSTEFVTAYEAVLKAQEETIGAISKTKTYAELDMLCRKNMETLGVAPHTHATGHGIGLDVHEGPRIGFTSKDRIKSGHMITIEPGTYIEGKFGIRIEDTVYVDKNCRPRILTTFPKALSIRSI